MRPEESANAALVRADVLVLLREKRYEEALAVLYRARADSPASSELQKSIDQIKEFLIGAYAKRLGGLDQVAQVLPVSSGRSPDVVLISRYVDGSSTFGDIAQMCPLGKLRTLQVLVALYAKTDARESSPELEGPRSGLHSLGRAPYVVSVVGVDDVEPAPETARSPSSMPEPVVVVPISIGAPPAPESAQDREYRELFGRGTVAFVQKRFEDAVAAFEACERLRPGDKAAAVMLRRSLRDLESR